MNLDFHYYGTYMAAREAGFEKEEAKKIAEAAQMVDDCTKPFLEEKGKYREDSTITCETFWESVKDTNEKLYNANDKDLARIRKIWMPFHFLPGNLEEKIEYQGDKEKEIGKFDEARDKTDFRCMCIHNSTLVKEMIQDTKETCEKVLTVESSDNDYKNRALALIGVRMHVLADTWAHEYFVGTPNYWINDANDFKKLEGSYWFMDESGTFASENVYSIHYLGHGRAGHYPDYGCLAYSYRSMWKQASEYTMKNNPYLFCCAYMQMVDAMKYIRQTGNTSEFVLENDETLMEKFDWLNDAKDIKKIIMTKTADQSSDWNKIANIKQYDKNCVDIDAFQTGAKLHFLFVKEKLNSSGIPYLN